jgi:hypothetical protein
VIGHTCLGCLAGRFAPVLVVALLGSVASADPILSFSTSGAFNVGTLEPGMVGTVSDGGTRLGIGDASGVNTFLVYHGQNYSFDFGASENVRPDGSYFRELTFGYFTLESTDPNQDLTAEKYRVFDGAEFTLSVNQTAPVVGDGGWASKLIHGTVWYSENPNSPGTSSYLGVKFADPLTFSVPRNTEGPGTIMYTIEPTAYVSAPNGQTGQQFHVNGHVSAVAAPLPGVAWLGLTLLGGVGGARGVARFRRRMHANA